MILLQHKKLVLIPLLVSALFILSGCSLLTTKVFSGEAKPKKIEVVVLTSDKINPDLNLRPSPVRLDFFQLVKYNSFNMSKYEQLIAEDSALGDDVLDVTEIIVHPNSVKGTTLKLMPKTKFLGIAGGFQDINNTGWKKLYIKQNNKYSLTNKNYLNLKITEEGILLLSKKQMKLELLKHHEKNPDDIQVNKRGKFIQKNEVDLSKGIFREQLNEDVHTEESDTTIESTPDGQLKSIEGMPKPNLGYSPLTEHVN